MNESAQQSAAPTAANAKRWRPRWADLPPDGQPGWREGLGTKFIQRLDRSVNRESGRSHRYLGYLVDFLPLVVMFTVLVGDGIPVVRQFRDFMTDSTWGLVSCFAIFALVSTALLFRRHRRMVRIAAARKAIARETSRYPVCLRCDYDVRHAPETCPECGEPVVLVRFGDE